MSRHRSHPAPRPARPAAAAVVHVVHPGELAIGRRGERLETLLGSCVAVLLHDPEARIGALCHIVHGGEPPDAARRQTGNGLQGAIAGLAASTLAGVPAEMQAQLTRPMPATAWAGPALFALQAMARSALRTQLATEGQVAEVPLRLQARVYGGGNMFPELFRRQHVGASNVDEVLARLAALDLPVIEQHTGGQGYRRLAWQVGPYEPRCELVAPFDAQSLLAPA
jgi:chemotaxis receptor (MCP) glutamine deamidase CheD